MSYAEADEIEKFRYLFDHPNLTEQEICCRKIVNH